MCSCIIFRWRPLYVCMIGRPRLWTPVALYVVQVERTGNLPRRRTNTHLLVVRDTRGAWARKQHSLVLVEGSAVARETAGSHTAGKFWYIKGLPRSAQPHLNSQPLLTTVGFVLRVMRDSCTVSGKSLSLGYERQPQWADNIFYFARVSATN